MNGSPPASTPPPATAAESSPPSSDARPAGAERPLRHRIVEEVLPNLAVLVTILAPLAVWSRLPDPMATHWGTGGRPDGAMPRVADVAVLGAAVIAVAYGPIVAARFPMPRGQAQLLVAVAGFGSVFLAGIRLAALQANLDAASWQEAGSLSGWTILVVGVAAVLAGAVGGWAARSRPELHPPTIHTPTPVMLAPGEAVVWTGRAGGRVPIVVATGLLVIVALAVVFAPPEPRTIVVIVLPLVALSLSALGQVRVTAGPRGLTVACGWLGWPRLRVPIEEIADVHVEDVVPMSYGGWGLRVVPGATAVVVRRGEGLRVDRSRGRTFVVTVDDAARAAGVLLAHRADHDTAQRPAST